MKTLKFRPSKLLLRALLMAALPLLVLVSAAPVRVMADTSCGSDCTSNNTICDQSNLTADQQTSCQHCGNTVSDTNDCLKNNVIVKRLQEFVDFLSAGVGIVVVATIITGGIQYSMAGGSPEAVNKAKTRLTNGVIALGVFLLIFSFLQWIVPGGLFNSSS